MSSWLLDLPSLPLMWMVGYSQCIWDVQERWSAIWCGSLCLACGTFLATLWWHYNVAQRSLRGLVFTKPQYSKLKHLVHVSLPSWKHWEHQSKTLVVILILFHSQMSWCDPIQFGVWFLQIIRGWANHLYMRPFCFCQRTKFVAKVVHYPGENTGFMFRGTSTQMYVSVWLVHVRPSPVVRRISLVTRAETSSHWWRRIVERIVRRFRQAMGLPRAFLELFHAAQLDSLRASRRRIIY